MKKIYQTPCVDITVIQSAQVLAMSLSKNTTGANENVVLTRENKDGSKGVGSGLWEDMK